MIELLTTFTGGSNRITVPFYELLPLVIIPSVILTSLITTNKLQQNIKQILSIPLLIAVFFVPFGFTNGNRCNVHFF